LLRGGVTDVFLFEVVFYPLGLFLNAAQRADRCSGQRDLGTGWRDLCHMLLEIGIEQLVRVQLWRITGQIEDLDLVGVLCQPLLNQLAMMHAQVIEDQNDLFLLAVRKPLQKANEYPGIQRAGKDLPAHLPFVGYRAQAGG